MKDLTIDDFEEFFGALYQNRAGNPLRPMNWQRELARSACSGRWPDYICVPTGAGKTSTIEIAVFALAVQADLAPGARTAPMRTFLVVDRRTVVSETYYRACKLRDALECAKGGVLKIVADRLQTLAGGETSVGPLSVVQLRGGIYRDRNWCDSLTQPMVVASTVDQVGSRLLFRGYGVSPLARPIQAAAVAYDSLVILDEAHISQAFSQTISQVRDYQRTPWTERPLPRPLRVVEMTATPPDDDCVSKLEIPEAELDDASTYLGKVVNTDKWTDLVVAGKAKGRKAPEKLAKVLAAETLARLSEAAPAIESAENGEKPSRATSEPGQAVAVMCNTVATAKATFRMLQKQKGIDASQVHLIIGAMRPIDRDAQTDRLRGTIATGIDRISLTRPLIVVATQCIEVGADYDFDILVSEAAPLDALVQRFGRLNRGARPISALGCIVMRGDRVRTPEQLVADEKAFKTVDPVYGNASSRTWNWLQSVAAGGRVNFGIRPLQRLAESLPREQRQSMVTSCANAPVLLPAHLDLLSQTSETPWPDPDISFWLHGPDRNDPEVQVCWRADVLAPADRLDSDDANVQIDLSRLADEAKHAEAIHALSLCPPASSECLTIPIRRFMAWLNAMVAGNGVTADQTGDIASIVDPETLESYVIPPGFRPIAWRGLADSEVVVDPRQVRPGDTLVLTQLAHGWSDLGYLPDFDGIELRDAAGRTVLSQLQGATPSVSQSVVCSRTDFQKIASIDVGDEGFTRVRRRQILRFHANRMFEDEAALALLAEMRNQGPEFDIIRHSVREILGKLKSATSDLRDASPSQLRVDYYARRQGIVITGPLQSGRFDGSIVGEDEADAYSRVEAGQPIDLADHLQRVRAEVSRCAERLAYDAFDATLTEAAWRHDFGKADVRFQALLRGGDLFAAMGEETLYAKSARLPMSLQQRTEARARSQLPRGFRHEMLSLAFAEVCIDSIDGVEDKDLLLHLIASHHGYARPWAPFVNDPDPPDVDLKEIEPNGPTLSTAQRRDHSYHRIESGVAHRFWKLTRRYGWWGLPMLESILRIADQRTSHRESLHGATSNTSAGEQPIGVAQ